MSMDLRGHDVFATSAQRAVYGTYKFVTQVAWLPQLMWRLARFAIRRERPAGLLEQQGLYTVDRPTGNPLIWFHANTAAEAVLCLPLIHRVVIEYNEKVLILVTLRCNDTIALLRTSLPDRVILLRAPSENPLAVSSFLTYWRPCIGVMVDGFLAPNLVLMSAQAGVPLALLDGSIPQDVFQFWHNDRTKRTLFQAMASAFSLIIPHSDIEVGRFRLLGAELSQMPGWCNDLTFACALSCPAAAVWRPTTESVQAMSALLGGRVSWMTCLLKDEEEVELSSVVKDMKSKVEGVLTVYVPVDNSKTERVMGKLELAGLTSQRMSAVPKTLEGIDVVVADLPWQVAMFMSLIEVVYFGSAVLPADRNHTLMAQAAVSSCALVANNSVYQHVQLAQELNTAAVNAAEDAATAVRTAGVDMELNTPWNDQPARMDTTMSPRGATSGAAQAAAAPTGETPASVTASSLSVTPRSPHTMPSRASSLHRRHPGLRRYTAVYALQGGTGPATATSGGANMGADEIDASSVISSPMCSPAHAATGATEHESLEADAPEVVLDVQASSDLPSWALQRHLRNVSGVDVEEFGGEGVCEEVACPVVEGGEGQQASYKQTAGTGEVAGEGSAALEPCRSSPRNTDGTEACVVRPAVDSQAAPALRGARRFHGISIARGRTRMAWSSPVQPATQEVPRRGSAYASAKLDQRGASGESPMSDCSSVAFETRTPDSLHMSVLHIPTTGAAGSPRACPEEDCGVGGAGEEGARRVLDFSQMEQMESADGLELEAAAPPGMDVANSAPEGEGSGVGAAPLPGAEGRCESSSDMHTGRWAGAAITGVDNASQAARAGSAAAELEEADTVPLRPPATLNRLRVRVGSGAPPAAAIDSQEGGLEVAEGSGAGMDRGASMDTVSDLWAGASPFLRLRSSAAAHESALSEQIGDTPASQARPAGAAARPGHARPQVQPDDTDDDDSPRVGLRRPILRYRGCYLLSALHLPQHPEGPAVCLLNETQSPVEAVSGLLKDAVMRQSRGHVAMQAAMRLSSGLVSTIWDVLDGSVLEPALLAFEGTHGVNGSATNAHDVVV